MHNSVRVKHQVSRVEQQAVRVKRTPVRVLRAIMFALSLAPALAHAGVDPLVWLRQNIWDRIEVRGSRVIGLHFHEVDGDRGAYGILTYSGYGNRTFTDIGSMNMTGKNVFGTLNFQTQIDTNRFTDPQSQRTSLDYKHEKFDINLGDIQGSLLNSNRFAALSKFMRGGMAGYREGRLHLKALYSEAKGGARTISIPGNNSAGPYYLQASQVVWGSEQVRVDGEELRLGADYQINYTMGSINFNNRIIAPTSTILVTFEVLGQNSRSGTVQGAGLTYDLGRAGRLGFTLLQQDSATGGSLSQRTELFQGSGPPSTPYFLQFEPLRSRPIVVKLDGIIQFEGVDYTFDANNPTIFYFTRFIPLSSTVDVTYTPTPTQTLDGDRRVLGWDYRLPLGKQGHISYMQATGEMDSDVNPLKGTARGIEGQYKLGKFELRGSLREVPDGYVSVETRGFNRNEKASDWGLKFAEGPLSIDSTHRNSLVSLRQINADGSLTFRRARATSLRSTASYTRDPAQPWNLEYTRLRSRQSGLESSIDSTALSTSRTFGRLSTKVGLDYQDARGPTGFGSSGSVQSVHLDTIRLDSTYAAGAAWNFGAKTSFSRVRAPGKDGEGTDLTLTAGYTGGERFFVNSSYGISDSGEIATLGAFQNGFGLGYGGNGFSGGTTGSVIPTGVTDMRDLRISSGYKISPRANLLANFLQRRSAGSVSSNSETTAYGLEFDWDVGKQNRLAFGLNQSRTGFIQSEIKADATTFDAALIGSPPGHWSYRLGFNTLLTGGNSQFKQDGLTFDAGLSYRIDARQRASASYTFSRTSGYLGQQDLYFALSHEYQLYRNMALVTSYKLRDITNHDASAIGGAFGSRGFDIELRMLFGG